MKLLIQRVTHGEVTVAGEPIGTIGPGLLVLVGFDRDDSEAVLDPGLERVLNYRVLADPQGKMNLSLADTGQGLLLVPQFTLCADTRKGRRPSFDRACPPDRAQQLFAEWVRRASTRHQGQVAQGRFGADMAVSLTNDGPVTFWLEVPCP